MAPLHCFHGEDGSTRQRSPFVRGSMSVQISVFAVAGRSEALFCRLIMNHLPFFFHNWFPFLFSSPSCWRPALKSDWLLTLSCREWIEKQIITRDYYLFLNPWITSFNTIYVWTGLNLWVPPHRALQTPGEGEHSDNGFVSFLMCWDALQWKRNYGLTAGRGPHKGQIIRGWWSEHAAHDQERQRRWKVIKVTRRVEPCKLLSQLAPTPLLDSSPFSYSLSLSLPFPASACFIFPRILLLHFFFFFFLSPPSSPLNSCPAFLSICPSFLQPMCECFCCLVFFLPLHPSPTDSWTQQLPVMCKSSK